MKTFCVALIVAVCSVALTLAHEKVKCFKDEAIVHDDEDFATCMKLCKEEKGFTGEITPEIYKCMLEHFHVLKDGQVDIAALKLKLNDIAQPNVLQTMVDVLDTKCTDPALDVIATCLDNNLEGMCYDGEQ